MNATIGVFTTVLYSLHMISVHYLEIVIYRNCFSHLAMEKNLAMDKSTMRYENLPTLCCCDGVFWKSIKRSTGLLGWMPKNGGFLHGKVALNASPAVNGDYFSAAKLNGYSEDSLHFMSTQEKVQMPTKTFRVLLKQLTSSSLLIQRYLIQPNWYGNYSSLRFSCGNTYFV